MADLDRMQFVPERLKDLSYLNQPLDIGQGQTISQPYIVAFITEALDLKPTDKVLEVGTGSGYQAAILAELASEVYTIEILPELAKWGQENLKRSGFKNVFTKVGNGRAGWKEHAPFDKIVLSAASKEVPEALVNQLKEGGVLIMPQGDEKQNLIHLTKMQQGVKEKILLPVRFVPLTSSENSDHVSQIV